MRQEQGKIPAQGTVMVKVKFLQTARKSEQTLRNSMMILTCEAQEVDRFYE